MKNKNSPQRHGVHGELGREELTSVTACLTPEVDSIFIGVHSCPFAVSPLPASIRVHLRLVLVSRFTGDRSEMWL
jgi:hypothetical protein